MKIHLNEVDKNVKAWNDKGFSMVEMLFSFSIFCLIASFLPLLFQIMFDEELMEAKVQKMEWELFVSQLKKEVQRSDELNIENNRLILRNGEEVVVFLPYQSVLRRQVNGKGHEVVLQNVKSVQFHKMGSSVTIQVEDIFEQTNSATIYSFITALTIGKRIKGV